MLAAMRHRLLGWSVIVILGALACADSKVGVNGLSAAVLSVAPLAGSWADGMEDGRAIVTADGTRPAPVGDPGAFPVAAAKDRPDVRQGRVTVEFKLIGGATDQTAGIVFDLRPDGRYHFARYNTKDGNVAIWKFQDGTRTVLAHGEVHRQLPLGQWHDLVVSIDGRTITAAAAGGTLTVRHTLEAPVEGRVGLWTKRDSITAFRGLTVN
jgi:hypothetical protein